MSPGRVPGLRLTKPRSDLRTLCLRAMRLTKPDCVPSFVKRIPRRCRCTCESSRHGVCQQGPGRSFMGAGARAASPWLIHFCALEHDEKCCTAGQKALAASHLLLPPPIPRPMTAAYLAACSRSPVNTGYCRLQRLKSTLIWRKRHFSYSKKA